MTFRAEPQGSWHGELCPCLQRSPHFGGLHALWFRSGIFSGASSSLSPAADERTAFHDCSLPVPNTVYTTAPPAYVAATMPNTLRHCTYVCCTRAELAGQLHVPGSRSRRCTKGKLTFPCRKSNSGRPARSPSQYRLSYRGAHPLNATNEKYRIEMAISSAVNISVKSI